jgi:hypothetical protein
MHATPKIRSQICPAHAHKTPLKVQVTPSQPPRGSRKEGRRCTQAKSSS